MRALSRLAFFCQWYYRQSDVTRITIIGLRGKRKSELCMFLHTLGCAEYSIVLEDTFGITITFFSLFHKIWEVYGNLHRNDNFLEPLEWFILATCFT